MKKSDIQELPPYFDRYIHLNDDIELSEAFETSLKQIEELDLDQLERIGTKVYAKGKWPVHKIIQHLTDWERIWCYRTLLSLRGVGPVPESHDEEQMAANSNADELPISQLIEELITVRRATIALYNTLNDDQLQLNCKFSKQQMSVLAMGFNIIGHQLHHFSIIRERYLPLAESNSRI